MSKRALHTCLIACAAVALAGAAAPAWAAGLRAPLTREQYRVLITRAVSDFAAATMRFQAVTTSTPPVQGAARLRALQLQMYAVARRIFDLDAPPRIKPVNDRLGRYIHATGSAFTTAITAGRRGDRAGFIRGLRRFLAALQGRLGQTTQAIGDQIDRYLAEPVPGVPSD